MDAIHELAEHQYGVITRTQAFENGVSDSAISRRVRSGRWIAVHPGVFRIAGAPVTGLQPALAATMWTRGVVSHGTAGWLLHVDGIGSDARDLTVLHAANFRSDDWTIHRTTALPDIDWRVVDGIRCTSATRTLIDCAPEVDDEALEAAFESARRMGLATLTLLQRRAHELCGRGRPGSARVRRVLATAGRRAVESRLEVKTARLLRSSRLPQPIRQYPLGRFRLDFAWPAVRVALECDGFEHHGARLAWKRDRRRIAAIEAMHWRIVHVTWDDITHNPGETIHRIAIALAQAK